MTTKTKATLCATIILTTLSLAQAQTFTMLHTFTGADGANPQSPLIADAAGNLYGTTFYDGKSGYGTVFKMAANHKVTVLYSFAGPPDDAANPSGPLLMDKSGTLYGTTVWGGASNQGAAFKLTATGDETVLYSFAGYPADGSNPEGGVIGDPAGNLYGTTDGGGNGVGCGGYIYGCGIVFEIDPAGNETILHIFNGEGDGAIPWAGLLRDSTGNLYGTTVYGGTAGLGTVFKVTAGTLTILHSFAGTDGAYPYGAVIRDAKGNLYGTAYEGGSGQVGTVFKLSKAGKLTVLHNFTGNTDGAYPPEGLVRDAAGNLFGATAQGGSSSNFGTVFKVDSAGKETILHSFTVPRQGMLPEAGLLLDKAKAGNLYGTTYYGGPHRSNDGTIFKLTP